MHSTHSTPPHATTSASSASMPRSVQAAHVDYPWVLASPPGPPQVPLGNPAGQRRRLQGPPPKEFEAASPTDGYDIGGLAPICWRTLNNRLARLASCPANVTIEFIQTPPRTMFARQPYRTRFTFTANAAALGLIKFNTAGRDVDIPYATIRSCRARVGFCTPFIEDDGDKSVHTAPDAGNLVLGANGLSTGTFSGDVMVEQGSFSNIAHVRWYTLEAGVQAQYDMAANFVRDALPPQKILVASPGVEYTLAAVIALACAFLAVNLALLFYYRKHKILKFSQVNILMYMAVAGFVALCGVPLAAVNTQQACSLRPWVTIIPLNVMFGLLFGKTWRIYRLMNNKQLKAIKIKESYVLFVAFLLTLPELLIHGFYFVVAPPKMTLARVINDYTFLYACTGGEPYKTAFDALHLAYAALILVLGCYVASKSQQLTTLFNEGKYILFAIYTCTVLAIIIVPASFAVATDPQTGYILRTLGVTMAVVGTIGGINVPKFQLIWAGVDLSLDNLATNASKAATTNSGAKTTSSNATSSNAAAGGAASSGGPPSNTLQVKSHVPSAVMEKLVDAIAAGNKVVDRQKQGYALARADWEACVEQTKGLHEIFQRCVLALGGSGSAVGGAAGAGGYTAKIAPSG